MHDGLSLCAVAARLAHVVGSVDGHEGHFRLTVIDGGEGVELAVIVLAVAEGNQTFVAAAVVPGEVVVGEGQRDAVVKDALHVVIVSFRLIDGGGHEETGGRHLLGVAHHDERLAAGNGTDGLTGRHLGGLVEDDDVELLLVEVDELGHGDGAHQHAGAQFGQQGGDLVNDLADGCAAASRLDESLKGADL